MVDLKLDYGKDFLEEEVRCDYTIDSEMKRIWAVELDLVNELKRVCDKYGIQYFADGGTLLGAIRHKGFIPWDNDIDLCMFRDQYEKLCEVAPREFKHPYFFQTEYTDPTSLRGHAQLRNSETTGAIRIELNKTARLNQGIFIDIFPLDGVPEDPATMEQHIDDVVSNLRTAKKLASMTDGVLLGNARFRPLRMLARHIAGKNIKKFRNYDDYYRKYEEECKKYDPRVTKKVAKYFPIPFVRNWVWNREDFDEAVEVPFEMITLPVPKGYENVLNTCFGKNWRTPLRVDTMHGTMLFDVDRSYREYMKEVNKGGIFR